MTEPSLDQVRGHVRLERTYPKSMTQPLRHGRRAGNAGGRHDFLDPPPGRRAAPFPNPGCGKLGIALQVTYLEDAIEFIEQFRWQRHLPNHPPSAPLERFQARDAAWDIN